jgi:hypothetical protein
MAAARDWEPVAGGQRFSLLSDHMAAAQDQESPVAAPSTTMNATRGYRRLPDRGSTSPFPPTSALLCDFSHLSSHIISLLIKRHGGLAWDGLRLRGAGVYRC